MRAIRVASTVGMTKDDWLAIRRTGIGSSDIAGVLGLSPWSSPYTVWADKRGILPPVEETPEMEVGTELEEPVARLFQRRHGYPVRRVRAILRHPEHSFALANLDRVTDHGQADVEIKVTGQRWDEIPAHYMAQVQWQLGVTGLPRAYLVPLAGTSLTPFRIDRDEELIGAMFEAARAFWERVQTGAEPDPSDSPLDAQIIARLHPGDPALPPVSLEADFGALEALSGYRQALADEKSAKDRKNEAANLLRVHMGEATKAHAGGRTVVTWSRFTERRLDSKALEAAEPEVYARFVRESPKQAFRVYGGDE